MGVRRNIMKANVFFLRNCNIKNSNIYIKKKIKFKNNIGRDWAAFSAAVLGNGVSVMHTVAPAQWESTVHLLTELRRETWLIKKKRC